MKFLLLLAFGAVGQCALLGSDRCTYGPSYWCSHVRHATECGAMQHCMDNAWKKQLIGATETCFDVVKILNTVRQSKESDMLEKLAMGCTGLTGDKRTECKQLMLHNKKAVFQLLKSDLSSGNIASALGLCGGSHQAVTTPAANPTACDDCQSFVQAIKDFILDTENPVEEGLKEFICSPLGSFESTCEDLFDQYAPSIIEHFANDINPFAICDFWLGCPTAGHKHQNLKSLIAKHLKSNASCDLCLSLAKDVQNTLRNPTLQTDILNLLESKVCQFLPANLAAQCKTYVSQYGPLVFQVLVAELDPQTICQTIGLCNGTKVSTKVAGKLTRVLLHPAGTVHILPEQPVPTANGGSCAICEFVMTELEKSIDSKSTEAEIKAALEKVCSLLPTTVKTQCDAFIKEYGDAIFNMLVQELSPEKICTALGLCSASKAEPEKTEVGLKGTETCDLCEEVMGYIKIALDNPSVDDDFDSLLEKACLFLPGGFDQMACKQLINKYGPALINLLKQYDDPAQICKTLHLCPAAADSQPNETLRPSQPLKFQPMMDLQKAARLPHLLGEKHCNYGPSYWCASLKNAKECNAEKLCRERYGKTFD